VSYMQEAVGEYAREHGRLNPDRAWILSPFDSWEPNPFYQGPPARHPEDDEYEPGEVPAIDWGAPF
jgi:hypothetical protein